MAVASAGGMQLFAQASKLKVNNEKAQTRDQVKRMHPHALKLILQGKKQEAIAYLEGLVSGVAILDMREGKQDAARLVVSQILDREDIK